MTGDIKGRLKQIKISLYTVFQGSTKRFKIPKEIKIENKEWVGNFC